MAQLCSAGLLIAIIAWMSLRMHRLEVPAPAPANSASPIIIKSSLENAETIGQMKSFAEQIAEARKLRPNQAALQDPLFSLPDVGDSELKPVKTVPWGGTDPDSFWRSQVNGASQTLREAGLGRFSR